MITLYHHPFSRAAGVLWSLEEVGAPYELVYVDIQNGDQKRPPVSALNAMGKIPVLVDGEAIVSESAAIALYLADRYALGTLAPAPDDSRRGAYLRWSLFAPSVVEPGAFAKLNAWEFKSGQAGWGDFASMQAAIDGAVQGGFVLGDTFSMADVILGGTLRYMTRFKMMTPSAAVEAYIERISARPALQRADTRNLAILKEHGLAK